MVVTNGDRRAPVPGRYPNLALATGERNLVGKRIYPWVLNLRSRRHFVAAAGLVHDFT